MKEYIHKIIFTIIEILRHNDQSYLGIPMCQEHVRYTSRRENEKKKEKHFKGMLSLVPGKVFLKDERKQREREIQAKSI